MKKLLLFFSALCVAILVPISLSAQGCALCYTQAAGSGVKMIAALKSGILVLMFPPMGICALITWLGYKKRNRYYSIEEQSKSFEKGGPNADLGW
jgi:energy-coupling factor transporter transmembrane protein EcfT